MEIIAKKKNITLKGSSVKNGKVFDSLWFHLDQERVCSNLIKSILAAVFLENFFPLCVTVALAC